MKEETTKDKIKNIVYKIILPVYLWSIDFKNLDDYITALEKNYQMRKDLENKILN